MLDNPLPTSMQPPMVGWVPNQPQVVATAPLPTVFSNHRILASPIKRVLRE